MLNLPLELDHNVSFETKSIRPNFDLHVKKRVNFIEVDISYRKKNTLSCKN